MSECKRPTKHTLLYAIRQNKPDEVHLAFGVSRQTLIGWCKGLGVEVPEVKHPGGVEKGKTFAGVRSKRPPREVLEVDCRTLTNPQIQEKYGVTYWTVWSWCKAYQIDTPCGGKGKSEDHDAVTPEPPQRLPSLDSVPRLAPERLQYWAQPNIGTL